LQSNADKILFFKHKFIDIGKMGYYFKLKKYCDNNIFRNLESECKSFAAADVGSLVDMAKVQK